MTGEHSSSIVIAVDAELEVLERRVDKLREIKRLVAELEDTRVKRMTPPMSAEPHSARRGRRKQSAPLTTAEALDVARELLADGPTTVGKILDRLGRSRTERATAAVEAALEQLGATVEGRARGGGALYVLAIKPESAVDGEHDRDDLLAKVREFAESAVGWSDEEFRYQLRKRCRIDVSLGEIRDARAELKRAAG
jgi:hypothetical protein